MAETPSGIALSGLTKHFGPIVAVDDLTLEVGRGEAYGFLGANGAGKTTTIRLLLDLLRPTRGRAAVLGIDCHRDSLRARQLIGYLPGELPVYPDLSADGFLAYLERLGSHPVDVVYRRGLLDRFEVSARDASRRLRDHSHGMRQKIGIIQALVTRPPVVILDEPTTGLDPVMTIAFRETIAELTARGDTTVFMSSHVLADVESTCRRIGLVRDGRIVTTGTIDELRQRAARRVIVVFGAPVDADPPPDATVRERTPTRWVLDVRGPTGPLVARLSGLPVLDLQMESFRLEDYVAQFYAGAVR
jgi:ABC-2 type transport system ATP-binding protein